MERVQAGESPEAVIKALGFHRGQIYDWLAAYREGGYEALKSRKAQGRRPKLSGQQLQQLFGIITTRNPAQLQFEFALWTRAMVRQLIRDRFAVRLSEISVGRLLRKIGLSPQKPLYRAYHSIPQFLTCFVLYATLFRYLRDSVGSSLPRSRPAMCLSD